jgi:hypothetical protein
MQFPVEMGDHTVRNRHPPEVYRENHRAPDRTPKRTESTPKKCQVDHPKRAAMSDADETTNHEWKGNVSDRCGGAYP